MTAMKAPEVYVGATKGVLIQVLEAALIEVRESRTRVSVTIYATDGEGSVTFSDEDTADDTPGRITIEA